MSDTIHLTCPACSGVNRVHTARLGQSPVCGRCGAALAPAAPMELDGPALERMAARDGLPLLVDFWSASCGPCRMMAPAFAQAAAQLAPAMRCAKVQTDLHPDAGARHGIRAVPTLILFSGGREAARVSGAMDAASIVGWAKGHA